MNQDLESKKIPALLFQLSLPAITSMLISAVYNIVDRIFVEKISPLALSGVGITMPIQILQMAFVLLIGIGSSTLISIKLGEKKAHEAEVILHQAYKYIMISMALFSLIMIIFMNPILDILNVSKEVYPYAKDYIFIMVIGSIFGLPGFCLNNSLRAIGKASISMKIVVSSAVINILLDPLFIFTFNMGVKGAALATVISQTYVTVMVFWLFAKSKNFPINLKFIMPVEKSFIKEIIQNGAPSFYMQIFATVVNIIFNRAVVQYGNDLYLAAMTIVQAVYSFYHMVVVGIVQGAQPIAGYNFGAKRYDRVRETLILTLGSAFVISISIFGIIQLYPSLLSGIFTSNQELLSLTNYSMKLYLFMLPLIGLHTVSSQYFQAVGKPKKASILSLLRYGLILIPLLFVLPHYLGIQGVFISNVISDFIASSVAIFFISKELYYLKSNL